MTFLELKTQFMAILNRSDISTLLVTTFINQGSQRAERTLRTPLQEVTLDITTLGFTSLAVPVDMVQMIDIGINSTSRVRYVPWSTFVEVADTSVGIPVIWTRKGNLILMKPTPADNTVLNLYYYGQFTPFTSDNQITSVSLVAPDLIIYAALKYAADYYIDERADAWEATYLRIVQELQDQAY